MELAEMLLQLISGSSIIVGTLNIVGLTEIGTNFTSKLRKDPPPEELFWRLFLNVGYGTLMEAAQEKDLLKKFVPRYKKKEYVKLKHL